MPQVVYFEDFPEENPANYDKGGVATTLVAGFVLKRCGWNSHSVG